MYYLYYVIIVQTPPSSHRDFFELTLFRFDILLTIDTVLTSKKSTGLPHHPAAVYLLHNQHLAPVYVDLPSRPTIPPQPKHIPTPKCSTLHLEATNWSTHQRIHYSCKGRVHKEDVRCYYSRSQATAATAT